jgi:cardiolipin synthase
MELAEKYTYRFYATTSEAWDAMYQALSTAQKSIYWEVFIFVDDKVGDTFVELLCAKAKAGVEVKMVIDAIGGFQMSQTAVRRLIDAGVDLHFYNRLYPEIRLWRWFSRLWFRNHRKVLVVDETTVFLGGVNIKASYGEWDDIYLKIQGLVPRPLLRGFAKSYISSGGKKSAVWHLLKPNDRESWKDFTNKLKFIVHSPKLRQDKITRKLYIKALAMAKESVNFLTPYYAPDKAFLKALTAAKKRGVKVNIFLPLRTDTKLLELIARAYFRLTLKAGANLYLLPKMNHGKAVTIDDSTGMVGSINMTPRSYGMNEESGVYFSDTKMVAELNAIFNSYKASAKSVDEAMIKRSTLFMRFKEWLATLLERYV